MFRQFPIPAAWAAGLLSASTALAQTPSFNPDLSVILDGRFVSYANDPSAYHLPGFALGGEAGLEDEGFVLGESELVVSANVDDLFFAKFTTAVASSDGETEVGVEEAYLETLGLGHGLTVLAGRFFSGLGYLNDQHPHAWDFADAPLVYRGLFGDQLSDDGVQLRWVAPTDLFLQLGAELTRGDGFPGGGATDGAGGRTLFAKAGGDLGSDHAWQAGLARWWNDDVNERPAADPAAPTFSGQSAVNAVDFVWKWAPHGNPVERNVKLQAEYLWRDEQGTLSDGTATGPYDGRQDGWYAQAVYQFMPRWRVGLRYDRLTTDNRGDAALLAAADLDDNGHTPQRSSVMVDYSHSEFSRLRLQFNRDESYPDPDDQVMVQYIMSIGAHGAHKF